MPGAYWLIVLVGSVCLDTPAFLVCCSLCEYVKCKAKTNFTRVDKKYKAKTNFTRVGKKYKAKTNFTRVGKILC